MLQDFSVHHEYTLRDPYMIAKQPSAIVRSKMQSLATHSCSKGKHNKGRSIAAMHVRACDVDAAVTQRSVSLCIVLTRSLD